MITSKNPECREVCRLRLAYSEDLLEPKEQFRFEHHIARCADCAAELAEMRGWVRKLSTCKDAFYPNAGETRSENADTKKNDARIEPRIAWAQRQPTVGGTARG